MISSAKYRLNINGKIYSHDENIKLMSFLRDNLRLTSVKDGCSEGACGSCTVLIDGKAIKACIQKLDKFSDKKIITLEGLDNEEAALYAHAFSHMGAVQCGFCTPAMILCAKALIDECPSPSKDQIKKAIKPNICRCTGYQKIIAAISYAAELKANAAKPPFNSNEYRIDAIDKALGKAEYVDDMIIEGMLYGGAVRTKHPRAKIISIDCKKAMALEGVYACLTADDIAGEIKIGHIISDWDGLIAVGKITRYIGDAIVLIAAKSKALLERAKELVEIEYKLYEPITSPKEALCEGAPNLHQGGNILKREFLQRGNALMRIKQSRHVVEQHFETPFTEHAFLEPECAIAQCEGEKITIYSADQCVYRTQKECAQFLGLPPENVRVIAKTVGGGFGGKEDMSVQHHAALLSYITKKPVKFKLSRQESINVHPKRHAMSMDFTVGCDEKGKLMALIARIIADTGAYASLGGPVIQRACTHAAGPYNFHAIDIEGVAVYTNNPPAGAFRGFGVTQSNFAFESCLDLLAEKVGITPYEIRYINALKPGDVMPNGQIADASTAIIETLEAIKPFYDANPGAGIACALKNSGIGVGNADIGRCTISVEGGKAIIKTSAACIGQGVATVLVRIAARALELSEDKIGYQSPDTALTPNAGDTTASRQTIFAGEAARRAVEKLKKAMSKSSLFELEGKEYYAEYSAETDKMYAPKSNPVSHVAYGYATHAVALDDCGKIKKIVAAHDVGTAINELAIEGQIEGGVVMGMGYAMSEDFPIENCIPKAKMGTLGLLRSTDIPEIESIILEKPNEGAPAFGAKGVGEISAVPTAAAIALAYYHRDGIFRNKLPINKHDRKN